MYRFLTRSRNPHDSSLRRGCNPSNSDFPTKILDTPERRNPLTSEILYHKSLSRPPNSSRDCQHFFPEPVIDEIDPCSTDAATPPIRCNCLLDFFLIRGIWQATYYMQSRYDSTNSKCLLPPASPIEPVKYSYADSLHLIPSNSN